MLHFFVVYKSKLQVFDESYAMIHLIRTLCVSSLLFWCKGSRSRDTFSKVIFYMFEAQIMASGDKDLKVWYFKSGKYLIVHFLNLIKNYCLNYYSWLQNLNQFIFLKSLLCVANFSVFIIFFLEKADVKYNPENY
jgi:hypothetical protein